MTEINPLFQEPRADWPELIARLSEPFPAAAIHWRAGAISRDRKRAQALPYAEPRVYEDRLNEICPGAWGVVFRPWGETRIICELTLYGVTRASTGEFDEESQGRIAQGTAAEAQAFKRACSKFGLGRYLYNIPIVWVDYDEEHRRLVDTPELSGRFVPGPEINDQERVAEADDKLTGERAEAMSRELEKLGVERGEQAGFAAAVLGRKVRRFTELSDREALEVWNVAKRNRRHGTGENTLDLAV